MNFWPFKKKQKPAPAPSVSPAKLDEGVAHGSAPVTTLSEAVGSDSTTDPVPTPPSIPLSPAAAPAVPGPEKATNEAPPAETKPEVVEAVAPEVPAKANDAPAPASAPEPPATDISAESAPAPTTSRRGFKPPILAPEPPNYTRPPLPPVSTEPSKFSPALAPDPPKPFILEKVAPPSTLSGRSAAPVFADSPPPAPAGPAVEKSPPTPAPVTVEAPSAATPEVPAIVTAPLPAFPAMEETAAAAPHKAEAPAEETPAVVEPEPEPVTAEYASTAPTFRTTGHVAGFILHGDGTWSLDATHVAYQHLNAGDPPVILSIPVLATHAMAAHGPTQHLVISVQGTLSGPMIGAVTQVFTYEGDRRVTGQIVPADRAAAGGALQYSTTVDVPGLILNDDGSYLLDPNDAAYLQLLPGERQVYAIPVTAFAPDGQSDLRELVVGINGREDGAVASGISAHGIPHGGCVLHDRLQQGPGSPAHLSFRTSSLVPGFSLRPDGTWSFDSAHPSYADVREGTVRIITVPVTAIDDHGTTFDTKAISITLHGTSAMPLLSAMVMSGMEGGSTVQGSLGVHAEAAAGLFQYSYIGELPAGFQLSVDGTWSFHAGPEHYGYLDAGHTEVVVAQVQGENGQGHLEGSMVAITVHGTTGNPSVGAVIISTHQGCRTTMTPPLVLGPGCQEE